MDSKVSVIITTHNRSSLLKRAIDSVIQQDFQNIEIIVVDDASTDNTKEICCALDVVYVRIEESRGGNYARNTGVSHSSGEYLAFLDDDDYWLPTKISEQVRLIKSKNCDFVGCGLRLEVLDPSGGITYVDKSVDLWLEGNISNKVLYYIPTTTSALLVRRVALERINGWDETLRFWQDYDLMIRLAQESKFYYVNESLVIYRVNQKDPNRLTNNFYSWKDNTVLFRKKHSLLYEKLSLLGRLFAKTLVWRDGFKRAKTCGIKYYVFSYFFLTAFFFTPFAILKRLKLL